MRRTQLERRSASQAAETTRVAPFERRAVQVSCRVGDKARRINPAAPLFEIVDDSKRMVALQFHNVIANRTVKSAVHASEQGARRADRSVRRVVLKIVKDMLLKALLCASGPNRGGRIRQRNSQHVHVGQAGSEILS